MILIINGFKFLDKNILDITVKEFSYFMAALMKNLLLMIKSNDTEAYPEEREKIQSLDFSNKLFGKSENGFGSEKRMQKKLARRPKIK